MDAIIGWDMGGAHLKAARLESGRIVAATQVPCPLWLGLHHAADALARARVAVGDAPIHAITMTGELADIFPSRAAGVAALAERFGAVLIPSEVLIYGGRAGFLKPENAADHVDDVASANWHATAAFVGAHEPNALFADMGSTTTDLIPLVAGEVVAEGYTDRGRLATGELVYTGLTRSFLMSICTRVPFRGRWIPLMNEYFANMADIYRVLGEIDESADQHDTADNRGKTREYSLARLARMTGRDAADASDGEWTALAQWFAESQLRMVEDAARLLISRGILAEGAPVVGAGAGRHILQRLAARLGRSFRSFDSYLDITPRARAWTSTCAPAVAVAHLAGRLGLG